MSDQPVHADEVEQMRAVYFRKTRLTAGVVYVVFALMAVGVGAAAYSTARMPAIIGGLVGFALGVPVFILEGRIPISAQAKRGLLVPVAVLGAVGASFLFDALSGGAEAAVSGATAGFLAAMIVGLAYFRRRLARDDAMLLRQKRLGFDPEHPWRWLR
jgi:membrane associated rhomboid family serine protease